MEEMARSEDYRLRVRMLNGIGFSATYFWHESPGWQAATLGARYIEKAAELGCSAMRTRVAGEILRARAEVSKGRGRDEGFANYVGLTEKALEIERARGDNIGIAYCLHGLGHAHFYQGRYGEALLHLNEAGVRYDHAGLIMNRADTQALTMMAGLCMGRHEVVDGGIAAILANRRIRPYAGLMVGGLRVPRLLSSGPRIATRGRAYRGRHSRL